MKTDKISKVTIYAKSLKIIPLPNTADSQNQLIPNCSANFKKLSYEPVNYTLGESGPLITASGIDNRNNARMISDVCTCPPGYKLTVGDKNTDDTCEKCPEGETSLDYDSNTCVSTANMPTDNNGNILTQNCEIWQKPVKMNIPDKNYSYCENCPSGHYFDGTDCKIAPKSWYVKVPPKS